jgi:mannose/fructose/N-acetylgalactosamine-specific phosphotransferase system component IIC
MFVLAHYWGIDEVGVFVVPAVLAILALRWAERRAKRAADEREADDTEEHLDVE